MAGRVISYYAERGQADRYRKMREINKTRYRKKTGSGKYGKRKWTEYEDEEVIKQEISDIELSVKLCRSATAIQKRRYKLKHRVITKYISI